jgi:F-type H+-transporting ATPase subunit alpha
VDADETTQKLSENEKRLTEILKQNQHESVAMEDQVILIFAANNG